MSSLPLVSHVAPHSIVAWRADGAVTLRQFLAEVGQLADLFPAGGQLLNMCRDRYRFSVGLAAAIVAGKVSLLPSTHTPEVVRQIKALAPDAFCLTDSDHCPVDLPQLRYPAMAPAHPETFAVPQIEGKQRIAVVFTSGSSGTPQPHPKTWAALVGSVRAEALRLGLSDGAPWTIIGTVPPQHMYGFESTVLLAWQSGNAIGHALPFYPADICQALAAVPTPRLLVSSPVHLRALLDAGLALPEINRLLSATAPLSAGSYLRIQAKTVVQDGFLAVPLGRIEFGTASNPVETITFGTGSITSVSGAGLNVPYGTTTDLTEYFFTPGTSSPITAGIAETIPLIGDRT